MLGERIRKLRKQKKMTLETLAGDALTKGMLSLIENNKANPSMESLAYIAQRLGVDVTDLLEEISSQELREVLEKAEKLFNQDLEEVNDQYKQLIALIEPYASRLANGYESARLLDIYSRSLYYEKKDGWKGLLDKAVQIYDQMNLTSRRASLGVFRSAVEFFAHDYAESLNIHVNERRKIETTHAYIDPMTRLSLDYHEAALHFAVGDTESATRVMNEAINFSKENRIFYLIDDLYRLAAGYAMMSKNTEKKAYYTQKLKQYEKFADDMNSKWFCELINIDSLISDEHDYAKAIEWIDAILENNQKPEGYQPYFFLEKGRALYELGHFSEALQCLEKINIPSYIHHPFDLSIFYIADSYTALCHLEQKDLKAAIHFSEVAVKNFELLPDTSYKDFCYATYQKVKMLKQAEE
ncbi:helix-turn-helix domain-containing protein [Cytobacillus solani]|uniref:DNA-binding protein n=1 Tax=Cytobacillus solani TaxID=1637975 RepID=A0A0Q3SFP9_9BACI|nr:helix-turn-helix domain-containing protein [Cytobacillus solani]KOP70951.1 DNA-binding protein [Bacillus sp. FJAT-21945]KQL18100.1 DNA-binding protein [Cytobacillus solani]